MTRRDLRGSKKPKKNGDRISDLPEDVVTNILSRLSAKDAVRTSLLSKSWEYKWTSIYNIDVEHRPIPETGNHDSFKKFMDTILLDSRNIKSFCLYCRDCGHDTDTWLSSVFKKQVESVDLRISPQFSAFGRDFLDGITLPPALLDCASLRALKVQFTALRITLRVPIKNFFPNLTSLSLNGLRILNDSGIKDTLSFDFPVLETLEIIFCRWVNLGLVEIFAPALRSFNHALALEALENPNPAHIIKIYGAKLKHLKVFSWFPGNISFAGSTVSHADLILEDYVRDVHIGTAGLRIRRLMKECLGLAKLRISSFVSQVLAGTESAPPLPKYDMLKELILSGWRSQSRIPNVGALFELLHAAPYLNVLVIDMDSVIFVDSRNGYDYDRMVFVPSCLATQLKTVEFRNFKTKQPHYRLAIFLLQNASELKEVLIFTQTGEEQVLKKLQKHVRAPTSLKVT